MLETEIETSFPKLFYMMKSLADVKGKAGSLVAATCEMRFVDENNNSFSQCLSCGSTTMLFSVSTVLCGGCFVVVPFPCFAKVLLCLNLSKSCANRFNTELSASLTSMLSASRQIATRRLSCLLASENVG